MSDIETYAIRENKNKIDLTLIPPCALYEEARCWMFGEEKYGRWNWKKLWGDKTPEVVMASLLRHSMKIIEGEERDQETGLYHAAHIRANAAMLLYYYQQLEKTSENNGEILKTAVAELYG